MSNPRDTGWTKEDTAWFRGAAAEHVEFSEDYDDNGPDAQMADIYTRAAAVLAHGRGEVMTRSENSEVVVAACEECPAYAPTSYGCDWCSLGQFEAPRGEVAAACPLRKGPIVLRLKEGV